jgi:hypothetical protein
MKTGGTCWPESARELERKVGGCVSRRVVFIYASMRARFSQARDPKRVRNLTIELLIRGL